MSIQAEGCSQLEHSGRVNRDRASTKPGPEALPWWPACLPSPWGDGQGPGLAWRGPRCSAQHILSPLAGARPGSPSTEKGSSLSTADTRGEAPPRGPGFPGGRHPAGVGGRGSQGRMGPAFCHRCVPCPSSTERAVPVIPREVGGTDWLVRNPGGGSWPLLCWSLSLAPGAVRGTLVSAHGPRGFRPCSGFEASGGGSRSGWGASRWSRVTRLRTRTGKTTGGRGL